MKYEVVGCFYGNVVKEYFNKYSAYNYARKCGFPCFVRSFNFSTGDYTFLREFL